MDYPHIFVILMGLGTVFFGLICLIVLTTIMGRVLQSRAAPAISAAGRPPVPVPAAAASAAPEPDRREMAAAIAAAVAEELGTDITGIRILSMRRV